MTPHGDSSLGLNRRGMVRIVLKSVLLGAIGGACVALFWHLLATYLWLPYWRELWEVGFYVYDIGAAYLIAFGPPVVGVIYAIAIASVDLIHRRKAVTPRTRTQLFWFAAVPGLITFALLFQNSAWSYPGAEASVMLVGTMLAHVHHRMLSHFALQRSV